MERVELNLVNTAVTIRRNISHMMSTIEGDAVISEDQYLRIRGSRSVNIRCEFYTGPAYIRDISVTYGHFGANYRVHFIADVSDVDRIRVERAQYGYPPIMQNAWDGPGSIDPREDLRRMLEMHEGYGTGSSEPYLRKTKEEKKYDDVLMLL